MKKKAFEKPKIVHQTTYNSCSIFYVNEISWWLRIGFSKSSKHQIWTNRGKAKLTCLILCILEYKLPELCGVHTHARAHTPHTEANPHFSPFLEPVPCCVGLLRRLWSKELCQQDYVSSRQVYQGWVHQRQRPERNLSLDSSSVGAGCKADHLPL